MNLGWYLRELSTASLDAQKTTGSICRTVVTMIAGDAVTYAEYVDSVVLFGDLLGITQRIESIRDQDDFARVAEVLSLLREQARLWSSTQDLLAELKASAISDSLVISIPYRHIAAACSLAIASHSFQYHLLLYTGNLMRGYMCRGPVYHSSDLCFGKGFQDAYAGEKQLKGPPRVVISPSLIDSAVAAGAHTSGPGYVSLFDYLRQDPCDERWHIDYLKPVGLLAGESADQLRINRKSIASWAEKRTKECSSQHIADKYRWILNYERDTRDAFDKMIDQQD